MATVIGINGACGRMSRRIAQLALEDPDLRIGAALEAPEHPKLGNDLGALLGVEPLGVAIADRMPDDRRVDVLIDFSLPAGTMAALAQCLERGVPMVIATTGHTEEQLQAIEDAAKRIAILMAPNMSLVVNLLFKLTRIAAAALNDRDFDVEIIERHHRFKKDSPSGTALHFAHIVQKEMGQQTIRHGREGLVGERPRDEIGMHAVRVGDNVGEHTIVFSTLGETMELVHKAHSRDSYARGALQAAKFLNGKPPGRYAMNDVLGI